MSIYSEIKKYLLYLVGAFCILIIAHIGLLYLYHDAKHYPLPGGTLNVWIVGKLPTLDITLVDTKIENNSHDTVLKFLFRGLLRYSVDDKKLTGDLANCSIDNFPTVRCTLNKNALWNDGTSVTTEDIIATYNYLRENSKNDGTKARLAVVSATEDKGDVVFQFKTRDATTVDILMLPVLRKSDIGEAVKDMKDFSYSGPYTYYNQEESKETILLRRNRYYSSEWQIQYFDQIRFGFGETPALVQKHIDADIILSDEALEKKWFEVTKYTRPVFYGAFLNATSLPKNLRNALLADVLGPLDKQNSDFAPQDNIFFWEVPNASRVGGESIFFQTVFSLWYSFGGTTPPPEPESTVEPILVKKLQYINRPGNMTPLFMTETETEITGKTPEGTTRVTVNNYALKGFNARAKQFSYRVKKEFNNLVLGENLYRVIFFAGNKQIGEETITIYHHTIAEELAKIKTEWKQKNTPKVIPKPVVIDPTLDPKKLYARNGKPMTMKIIVQSDIPYLAEMGEKISTKLMDLGVTTEIQSSSMADLQKNIQNPAFSYDIILTWINLGVFHYNIGPFFHSGQVREWYNLSRVRDARLDNLLEKLTDRIYDTAPDKLRAVQININKTLEQESLVYALGSPYEYMYAKSSVLGRDVVEFIPGRELLIELVANTYFKEGYKREKDWKNVAGFIEWLYNELFRST